MAKCNLFRKLEHTNGTLLSFSQYGEDITRSMQSNDAYCVVPSRFVCVKLNDVAKSSTITSIDDANVALPTMMQSMFENACVTLRTDDATSAIFRPTWTQSKLWSTLALNDLITIDDDDACDNIVYVGDINIINYASHDGIGYNELYCHIPSTAKRMQVSLSRTSWGGGRTVPTGVTAPTTIVGWTNDNKPTNALSINALYETSDNNYTSSGGSYDVEIACDESNNVQYTTCDDDSFTFDAIVVLYNIVSKTIIDDTISTSIVHANVPMALYVAGTYANGSTNDTFALSNATTKYVSNANIYGEGTSWGLRIAQRYMTTPNASLIEDEIIVNESNDIVETNYASLMNAFNETCNALNECYTTLNNDNEQLKTHISQIIAQSRVNVPYIRNVDGIDYWFVNGVNTNVPARASSDDEHIEAPTTGGLEITDSTGNVALSYDPTTNRTQITSLDVVRLYVDGREANIQERLFARDTTTNQLLATSGDGSSFVAGDTSMPNGTLFATSFASKNDVTSSSNDKTLTTKKYVDEQINAFTFADSTKIDTLFDWSTSQN